MSSEAGGMCEVNLHMTPLKKSHKLREMVEEDPSIVLPSWIQHWAVIFLWRDADKSLRFEGIEEDGKCEVKVREMDLREGEQQPGTKVQCGEYEVTLQHVKDVAANMAANPPEYDQFTASCHTTAKKLLDELGIKLAVNTALEQVTESTLKLVQALGGPEALKGLLAAIEKVALNAAAE
ncbi:uncharacterized protein LOC144138025 isoform X1 [Haemaphysalis longicornis]